jgi:hypothetical protein
MPQVAIEFNLLSEFLRPALKTNQIAKNCTQDTLKKEPIFIGCKMSELFESHLFKKLKNTLIFE